MAGPAAGLTAHGSLPYAPRHRRNGPPGGLRESAVSDAQPAGAPRAAYGAARGASDAGTGTPPQLRDSGGLNRSPSRSHSEVRLGYGTPGANERPSRWRNLGGYIRLGRAH